MQGLKKTIYSYSVIYGKRLGIDLPYFLQSGFWVTVRQIIEVVAGLALSIIFARLASQEIYGQYQFILAIFATVSILSIPGLNTSIIKSVAEGREGDYKKAVKTSLFWSFLGIPILFLIGGYQYFAGNLSLGLAIMGASVFFPFFYAPNTWVNFFQGKKRFDKLAIFRSFQMVINAVATIIVIYFYRDNLIIITLGYLFSYTLLNVLIYFRSLKYIENQRKDKETIPYGFFMSKLSIIGIIANNIDKLIIGIFLTAGDLAVYSIGILFTNQVQSFSKSLLWTVSVKAIKQKILTKKTYLKIFGISILATIIFLLSFEYIIPLLFTDKYTDSIILSKISILFFPFFVLALLYNNEYIFNARKSIMLKDSFITPTIRIILAIIVLPIFGIKGLAFLFGFKYVLSPLVLYVLNYFEKKK